MMKNGQSDEGVMRASLRIDEGSVKKLREDCKLKKSPVCSAWNSVHPELA